MARAEALAAFLAGCSGSPATWDTTPVWACAGGAAGPLGFVGAKCAYTKADDAGDACLINPLAVALYAAAGCAGAAVATHLWGTPLPRPPAPSSVTP